MNDDEVSATLKKLYVDPVLTINDKAQMLHYVLEDMHAYITSNIALFAEENFHNILHGWLLEKTLIGFENIHSFLLEEEIIDVINEAEKIYFLTMIPRRSYRHLCKPVNAAKMLRLELQINLLRNKPQPEQRTPEWYEFRNNLITASSAWKTFGSQALQNSLIYEKCRSVVHEKQMNCNTDSPLHWGQKYEPLSVMLYEKKFKTKVEDFGCIRDDNFHFIGASPDGINVDKTSHLYGRMLEIKNIVNRDITGIPKKEYWIQMQLQMNVCKLNECDFLETRFHEYESYNEFIEDSVGSTILLTKKGKPKGMFMCFSKNQQPFYVYPPLNMQCDELEVWEETQHQTQPHTWIRNIYWSLDELSCVLVCRNKPWFNYAVQEIGNLWKIIEHERINGCEHRAPNRKRKTPEILNKTNSNLNSNSNYSNLKNKCLIDIKVTKLMI